MPGPLSPAGCTGACNRASNQAKQTQANERQGRAAGLALPAQLKTGGAELPSRAAPPAEPTPGALRGGL